MAAFELPVLDEILHGKPTSWSTWSELTPLTVELRFRAGGPRAALAAQVSVTEDADTIRIALVVGIRPEFTGKIMGARGWECRVLVPLASPLDGRNVEAV